MEQNNILNILAFFSESQRAIYQRLYNLAEKTLKNLETKKRKVKSEIDHLNIRQTTLEKELEEFPDIKKLDGQITNLEKNVHVITVQNVKGKSQVKVMR